jgi:hypothetical protein
MATTYCIEFESRICMADLDMKDGFKLGFIWGMELSLAFFYPPAAAPL